MPLPWTFSFPFPSRSMYFFFNIYLFYLFLVALGLSCGTWDLHCSAQASLSLVVVHELSCPTACGILVPRPVIEPASSALVGRFFTTGPSGKSLNVFLKQSVTRTSLMVQWLRIRLPKQGTWVRSLVREDPTCPGAIQPVSQYNWCVLQLPGHFRFK